MKKVKESNAAIKIILLTIFVILFIAVYFIDSVFLAGDAISYGKFSFIGKLIPSVILAAAFAALCFAKALCNNIRSTGCFHCTHSFLGKHYSNQYRIQGF